MPAGLEVYTDTGVLQVTDTYSNYLFDRKVLLTGTLITTWPKYGYFYTIEVDNDSMVAFMGNTYGSGNFFVGLNTCTIGSTKTVYEFFSHDYSNSAPSATFYIFSINKEPPSSNYGLEVYTDTGKLAFSSNAKYMKPITTWSGLDYRTGMSFIQPPPGYNGGFDVKSMITSFGTSKAITVASPSGWWALTVDGDGDGTYFWDEDIWGCSYGVLNNTLYVADNLLGGRSTGPVVTPSPPNPASYEFPQYYGMLIDVTGL